MISIFMQIPVVDADPPIERYVGSVLHFMHNEPPLPVNQSSWPQPRIIFHTFRQHIGTYWGVLY